jgi:Zn-dependent protease with chaperone function
MTLAVLCLAAFAIVSYAVSGGVALGLRVLHRPIERLAPAAQARLYLLAALLPFLASVAVLTAVLAPYFGWITDHCGILGDPHAHPHICAEHHVVVWPAIPLLALAFIVTSRFLLTVARRSYALLLGQVTRRTLDRASIQGEEPGVRVLPFEEAQAFVLGLFRPTLYITQGLISGPESHHLQAVMAHERAHLRRLDSLRRFLAGIGLSFHLPGIAHWITRCLTQAQEMAADDVAAEAVGSRRRVARALVALARSRCGVPQSAFAFSGSDVELRVVQLMDARTFRDWPKVSTLVMGVAMGLALVAVGADGVHHGVEFLLGALGR